MAAPLRPALEMSLAMAISGSIAWLVVASGQPLPDLLFWRCVFGAAMLLVTCLALGLLRQGLTPRSLAWAAFGGVALVCNWLLIFASFSHAPISMAVALYNTQPFMLVGVGMLLFSERLTLSKAGWLLLAFAGVVLIALSKPGGGGAAGDGGGNYLLGVVMALGAALCYTVTAVVAKKLRDMPPHLMALIQVCVGMLMMAPLVRWQALPSAPGIWGIYVVMGVVYTGLVFILLYGAIQKLPTAVAGALSFINPVVAIAFDFVVFGQRLTLAQCLGGVAILLASAAMTFDWRLPGQARPGSTNESA